HQSVAINQHNPDPLALQVRIPLYWIGYFYLAFFYLHVSQSKERMQMSLNNPCSHIHNRLHTYQSSRSEEHTSELQSRFDLVCRLLLEKKNERLDLNVSHTLAKTG